MAQNQGNVPENLKEQLSLAVRSIQWSYAIFWSISATQPGVLEWGDGYYNGDIKTRKTIQAVELNADELGLQRSEQLRELYESLSASESNPQSRRPSAALSPEDLSDTEWYYLVCMSFVFNIGEGLPGRTLAAGKPIWLCNAHYADSKLFSRSLLAKSASIQTLVCFPFLGGVIELGTTELVTEDPNLIHHVKTTFLESPRSICSKKTYPGTHQRIDQDLAFDSKFCDTEHVPVVPGIEMGSPNISSTGLDPDDLPEDSFIIEGITGGTSQVQSWHFVDEEFSNGFHHSMNSSDCISQTFVEPGKTGLVSVNDKRRERSVQELGECDRKEVLVPVDPQNDDLHYESVISSLLKSQHQLILGPHSQRGKQASSFARWKKDVLDVQKVRLVTPQKLLKKVLFEVPKMHDSSWMKFPDENGEKGTVWRPNIEDPGPNHVATGGISKRFNILKSIIPSIDKVDQVNILDDTIDYLKELKRRVDELESCKLDSTELASKLRKKPEETAERSSDNYENVKVLNKRSTGSKRKARDHDEMGKEVNCSEQKSGSTSNLAVGVNGRNVQIEIRCSWREGALLEIMEAISNLRLDAHTVQSSTLDGILSLDIKCKFRGSATVTAGLIRQALDRVVQRC